MKLVSHKSLERRIGVLGDYEIRITPYSRLRCRLIIAKNKKSMQNAYRIIVGYDMHRKAAAAAHSPSRALDSRKATKTVHDERYFAVIFLNAKYVPPDIVAHECGHAAIFYSERCAGHTWSGRAPPDERDEKICYPLGHIFSEVSRSLFHCGLWGVTDIKITPKKPRPSRMGG